MTMANRPVMRSVDWVLLVTLSVLWGGSFFFSKVALAELQPFTVVLGRVAIAALVLHLIVRATGQKMPSSIATWGLFFVMGAFILGERLDLRDFGGMVLIGLGLAFIDGRLMSGLSSLIRRKSATGVLDDYQI